MLVRSACSLLRQLANSDAIKAEIVDAGGLELLCRAVDAHSTHAGKTVTLCCGLRASLIDWISDICSSRIH